MTRSKGVYCLGLEGAGCIGTRYGTYRTNLNTKSYSVSRSRRKDRLEMELELQGRDLPTIKKSFKIYLYAKKQGVQE